MSVGIEARDRVSRSTTKPRSLARPTKGRLLYGVAAGVADYAAIDATLVRTSFALLSLAGGLGIVVYLGLALLLPERDEAVPSVTPRRTGLRPVISVMLITAGLMLAARQAGYWFGDALVGPVAIAAFGALVLWMRGEPGRVRADVAANPIETLLQGRVSATRVAAGAFLVFVAAATFLAANSNYYGGFDIVRALLLPVLATIAGLLLIFGPWLYRLASQLTHERRERIRSEERSALAAHLHDSVLQTLALIQRTDDSHRMSHLARTQERELRAWLFGKAGPLPDETLVGTLEALAGRCESRYPVGVDVVVVGDVPLDDRIEAVIAATREALNNAAAHSEAAGVSLYAEAEVSQVTIYVRDQGRGFDLLQVPADRRGIRDSIEGRMRRAGGTAVVQTAPGEGTEVILTLPRTTR
ncbi:MAG TPA: PspC domain-containing protein [Actinomycetota bacterium]|nr:PspC domain-containing protein [Actinomycetota bacterium]